MFCSGLRKLPDLNKENTFMTYSEFLDASLAFVRTSLPDGCDAALHTVIKNNDTRLDGLTITEKDCNIAPTIYLNSYYDKYCSGKDLAELMDELMALYENSRPKHDIDISFYNDYEQVRKRVVYKLVSFAQNQKLLSDVPYVRYLDLAVVFYCLLSTVGDGTASVLIHNHHLPCWDATADDLYEAASINTPRLLSCKVEDMSDLLFPVTSIPLAESGQMFVLSNYLRLNGASCLLYTDLLEQLAAAFGSGYYVLPSSIHEVILVPSAEPSLSEELSSMVREVNRTQVAPEEILSDHAYYYDTTQHQLIM